MFCESWESGGIEFFLNNVLLHMDLAGMEIDIVAARVKESVFNDGLKAAGVRFIQLSGNLRNLRANHRLFQELLRQRKYDVAHFNLYQGLSFFYVRNAQKEGVPVRVVHSHNTALRKSLLRPFKLALHHAASRMLTNCATDLWACSADAARFLFAPKVLEKQGFRFIPNGIDTARFSFDPAMREDVRSELGLSDAFVVGNVGRLCYQKNQDFLLDIFATLLKRRPESRLLLVGEGDQKVALQNKAARLGIIDQVIFYGTSNCPEQLYWAMDVFIFPSRFEGLGIVAVEAQAAGLPVLCSEHIPAEANITSLFRVLPLSMGADGWADAVLNLHIPERACSDQLVRDAGFNVADVAQQMRWNYAR